MTAPPQDVSGLLASWGIPATAALARAERGTNNQTFLVGQDAERGILRISENLSAAQVRAEHRLLAWLRPAGLPFRIPEPVPTLAGDTVAETPWGPASLCRRIPGVRPDLASEPALERFGRAIGLLSDALRLAAPEDSPHDWRGEPLRAHPEMPDVHELVHELRAAGAEHAALLETAADRIRAWRPEASGELPVQVVHGDPATSNTLVDERTGQVTGLLDFEIAGADLRVQDLVAALVQSGALDGSAWPRRVAALVRGYASALSLTPAEIQAIPPLLLCRCVGSVQWRAGRWHRGQARLAEVTGRLAHLNVTMSWLAVSGEQFLDVIATAAPGGQPCGIRRPGRRLSGRPSRRHRCPPHHPAAGGWSPCSSAAQDAAR